MTDESRQTEGVPGASEPPIIASLVHLSGPLRGTTQRLTDLVIRIGTAADAEVHFPTDRAPNVGEHHATLTRQERTYVIRSLDDHEVRVNGGPVERRVLECEDVIELGARGPILRFRCGARSQARHKSMREALADCVDCARATGDSRVGAIWAFLRTFPHELMTQTTPRTRGVVVAMLFVMAVGFGAIFLYGLGLERRLARESARVYDIAALLEGGEEALPTRQELGRIRADLEGQVSSAVERVEALEARSSAAERVIETAARSVVFLQGSYGFLQPPDQRPLRVMLGPGGQPLTDARGNPLASPDADGPRLERQFTGTGFVITEGGFLLTNRHIVVPWDFDPTARRLVEAGLTPVMYRLIGYVPDTEEPFELETVGASESADVAVLRADGLPAQVIPLVLSEAPPQPGAEVLVLGYPTGIRALLARTDPAFVDELMQTPGIDFWEVARRLSQAGHIAPLATRGIVGQVTSTHVVYDAETTRGGSGGPVLGLDDRVIAVNAAVLNEFGGSNLGVPAAEAFALLEALSTRGEAAEGSEDPQRLEDPQRPGAHGPGTPDTLPRRH
jgi:S1-C subfamily serine protease